MIGDGSCDVHTCWVSGGEDRRDKQGEEAAKTFFLLSRFTWAVASTVQRQLAEVADSHPNQGSKLNGRRLRRKLRWAHKLTTKRGVII